MTNMKIASRTNNRITDTRKLKVTARKAGKRHLNEHKSSRVTRRLTGETVLSKGEAAKVKKLLAGHPGR